MTKYGQQLVTQRKVTFPSGWQLSIASAEAVQETAQCT